MIPLEVLQEVTAHQAWHYNIVPFRKENGVLWLYANDTDANKDELELILGKTVHFEVMDSDMLRQLLSSNYRRDEHKARVVSFEASREKDFLNSIIAEARRSGSSDIHIEPYEERSRIRFRIDGMLIERYTVPPDQYPALINKIKIRANLDIAEKRLPQDGRIFFESDGMRFDIRVSSLPTLHGEKIVMRLLSANETKIHLDQLGFEASDLDFFLEGVQRPNGMVLISGPTGSGKTTTLYATLQMLNRNEHNIVTIEDPIEYTLEGVNQVQLKEMIGLDFTSALRTFLRQDPDIIMVGEIRDVNTASMAIRASLTGHLVLSTIHTNSAWGIVSRLIDMGVPSYLLADTLNTAVAQRLVRLLCPHCKKQVPGEKLAFPRTFKPPFIPSQVWEASGCEQCFFTGYKGRRALYEVIPIDSFLSEKIKGQEMNMRPYFEEMGFKGLAQNAFAIMINGETSLKEIYPILSSLT